MPTELTADRFVERLTAHRSPEQLARYQRAFRVAAEGGDQFIGVRMGQVFALAKEFIELSPAELERLLDSPIHEVRAGALSIMDKQARRRRTPADRRRELFELYLRRIDRIDNWDLVDLAAPYVVGGYLVDRPRDVLDGLARSENPWERRTAIVATGCFIRQGEVDDTFRIAELLAGDGHELVQKATGWMLREAGKRDRERLLGFLDRHAANLPRPLLRYAIEHLDQEQRAHYLGMRKAAAGEG